jgi:hypothetical protein
VMSLALAYSQHARLFGILRNAGCPIFAVDGVALDVILVPKREPRSMRCELSDHGWDVIDPTLPSKPRGVPRG